MKLFRFRFILLGLLLCVYHVWCLTCGTEFDDEISNAYLAEFVVIGKFSQVLLPSVNNLNNYTISISKYRNVLKGGDTLKKLKLVSRRGTNFLTVGPFGTNSPEYCSADIEQDKEYIFYMKGTSEKDYFRLSAMPVVETNKKAFKRAKKGVKKVTCQKSNCGVKLPEFDSRRMMHDLKIEEGNKLELNCKLIKKPVPNSVFTWLKDGQDINTLKIRGLRIKTNKKGSRLTIRRASESDGGNYECIAKNVGGEIKQQAVIIVSPKETNTEPVINHVAQKFKGTLEITCKVQSNSKTRFKWLKGNREIHHGDHDGNFLIRTKSDESTLQKLNTLLSDEGIYTCIANEKVIHKTNVTVTDVEKNTQTKGPKREILCSKEDEYYCLNNGTCKIFVELNQKFCECTKDYTGQRCQEYNTGIVRKVDGGDKLAQDRTIVIVGIISGILLFIGICIASYFLAKRRRDQFHRRRSERMHTNIEDNIPQVYRPLIGCDEMDGLKTRMNGVLIHKEVQTIETCFLGTGADKSNLYINPLETYVRNEGDRNSRPRKTAVSLETDPRERRSHSNNELNEERNNEINNRKNNPIEGNDSDRRLSTEKASDGAPKDMLNDLSPKPNMLQKEAERPHGATPQIANIPSPKSSRPPKLDLDTDSEEDIPGDGKPLTPLHISEDEDNSEIFKKCKPKTREEQTAEIFKKCRVKANVLKAFAPSKTNEETPSMSPSISKEKNLTFPINSPENNTAVSPSAEDTTDPKTKPLDASSSANDDSDSSSTTTEGCDSPNTAFLNSLEFESSPTPPQRNWNERGSPELSTTPASYSNPYRPEISSRQNHAAKAAVTNFARERSPRGERRSEESRNRNIPKGIFGPNIKDKFSIHL